MSNIPTKFTRKCRSMLLAARKFWQGQGQKARRGYRPNLDLLEDRTVPAVTATFQNNILTITNTAIEGEVVAFAVSTSGTDLDLTSTVAAFTAGTGTVQQTTKEVSVPGVIDTASGTNALQKIVILSPTGSVTTTGVDTLINDSTKLPATTELDYFEPDAAAVTVDDSTITKDIYAVTNLMGPTDSFMPAPAGINIANFSVLSGNGSMMINLTTPLTTGAVGLDFRGAQPVGATAGVQVNLTTNNIGGYSNNNFTESVTCTAPTSITAVYGSPGNDSITGNDAGNLLIGGEGSNNIIGGAGNDEMYGTFAPTPAYGGSVTKIDGVSAAISTATSPAINPALVPTLNAQFTAAAMANSYTATSISNTVSYSKFNFGSGTSFLSSGTNTITSATLNADITNATNTMLTNPGVTNLLFGGAGNNSIFGFASTHIVANATTGNNVGSAFSTSLSNTWQFGTGSNLYDLSFGDVANVSTNNPTASGTNSIFFVGGTPNVPTFISLGGNSTNTIHLDSGAKQVQINCGTSTTTIMGGSNDPSNVVTLDSKSTIVPGLSLVTRISNGL